MRKHSCEGCANTTTIPVDDEPGWVGERSLVVYGWHIHTGIIQPVNGADDRKAAEARVEYLKRCCTSHERFFILENAAASVPQTVADITRPPKTPKPLKVALAAKPVLTVKPQA